MMHTHLYRNSSNSFWSEDEEEDEVERWNNNHNNAVLWQAPPYYNATLGPPPPTAPPPPYYDYHKAHNHSNHHSFWRKLFSSRMWKQCWGYPQPRSRGQRSHRPDEYQYPNQVRQQLSKLLVHPHHGGVSPTCSISSSYPQSSVSGDEEDVDDASSVSSQSLSDEEDCRILRGSHPKEQDEDPRSSFVSIPLPPSGSPRRRRPPVRNVVRRTSRADSVSSANSRHRREKALLPPITDIYFNNTGPQQPGMQRVVSELPMDDDDDDDSMAQHAMHPTDLPPELQQDDEDDDVLFHLSSSSASSGPQRGTTKPRLAAPEDWMLEWAGSGEQPQTAEEEDPIPIPPHPVLFTAGWAVMNEHSAAPGGAEQQHSTQKASTTVGCVHVVLIEQTDAPCLWFTPKDEEGRAIPCAPWDVTSGQDCVWIRSTLSLQPLSTQHHDTLLFWRMGLDAALRHNRHL